MTAEEFDLNSNCLLFIGGAEVAACSRGLTLHDLVVTEGLTSANKPNPNQTTWVPKKGSCNGNSTMQTKSEPTIVHE